MLIVFGGLPGTGKTTIARALATCRCASYLRIDIIEQALRSAGVLAGDVGSSGYIIGNALAASNLANGQTVIVDCVNPVRESRRGWQATAERAKISLIEIEVVCSDPIEHRRRVEERTSDIDSTGLHPARPPGAGSEGWRKLHIGVDPDSGRLALVYGDGATRADRPAARLPSAGRYCPTPRACSGPRRRTWVPRGRGQLGVGAATWSSGPSRA